MFLKKNEVHNLVLVCFLKIFLGFLEKKPITQGGKNDY